MTVDAGRPVPLMRRDLRASVLRVRLPIIRNDVIRRIEAFGVTHHFSEIWYVDRAVLNSLRLTIL